MISQLLRGLFPGSLSFYHPVPEFERYPSFVISGSIRLKTFRAEKHQLAAERMLKTR
jgi:hypothetical protein